MIGNVTGGAEDVFRQRLGIPADEDDGSSSFALLCGAFGGGTPD